MICYFNLAVINNKEEDLTKTIRAYEEALKIYIVKKYPLDYAMTQNNLGNAYRMLAEVEDRADNCKKAIKAYEEALKVFTEEEFPEIYTIVKSNFIKLLESCNEEDES